MRSTASAQVGDDLLLAYAGGAAHAGVEQRVPHPLERRARRLVSASRSAVRCARPPRGRCPPPDPRRPSAAPARPAGRRERSRSSGATASSVCSSGVPTGSVISTSNSPWCTSGISEESRPVKPKTISGQSDDGQRQYTAAVAQRSADPDRVDLLDSREDEIERPGQRKEQDRQKPRQGPGRSATAAPAPSKGSRPAPARQSPARRVRRRWGRAAAAPGGPRRRVPPASARKRLISSTGRPTSPQDRQRREP